MGTLNNGDTEVFILGFRIVVKQFGNGFSMKAFSPDIPALNPFIQNVLNHLPPVLDETTFKRFLKTAIIGYQNSLK
jgi:hypothetical protein